MDLVWKFFKKLREAVHATAIPLLNIYSRCIISGLSKFPYLLSPIYNSQNTKPTYVDKQQSTMKFTLYLPFFQKKKTLTFLIIQMEDNEVSKVSQA